MIDTKIKAILAELNRLDDISAVLARRIADGEDSEDLWSECDRVTSEFDCQIATLHSHRFEAAVSF